VIRQSRSHRRCPSLPVSILTGNDPQVTPHRGAVVDLRDQFEAMRAASLAEHQRPPQLALGIDGRVVPVVTTQAVQGIVGITRWFLREDDAPRLVDLDRAGPRGKGPLVPGGGTRPGPRQRSRPG
jgi:hypothetical protein